MSGRGRRQRRRRQYNVSVPISDRVATHLCMPTQPFAEMADTTRESTRLAQALGDSPLSIEAKAQQWVDDHRDMTIQIVENLLYERAKRCLRHGCFITAARVRITCRNCTNHLAVDRWDAREAMSCTVLPNHSASALADETNIDIMDSSAARSSADEPDIDSDGCWTAADGLRCDPFDGDEIARSKWKSQRIAPKPKQRPIAEDSSKRRKVKSEVKSGAIKAEPVSPPVSEVTDTSTSSEATLVRGQPKSLRKKAKCAEKQSEATQYSYKHIDEMTQVSPNARVEWCHMNAIKVEWVPQNAKAEVKSEDEKDEKSATLVTDSPCKPRDEAQGPEFTPTEMEDEAVQEAHCPEHGKDDEKTLADSDYDPSTQENRLDVWPGLTFLEGQGNEDAAEDSLCRQA